MVERYFGSYYRSLGLSQQEFMAAGAAEPQRRPGADVHGGAGPEAGRRGEWGEPSCTARSPGRCGRGCGQQLPEGEIPITHITNGVHPATWVAGRDIGSLYDRYLGPWWKEDPADADLWEGVEKIPSAELWRGHERRRERLVSFARQRLEEQSKRQGLSPTDIERAIRGARSGGADHRVQPPVRDLQAGDIAVPPSGEAGGYSEQPGAPCADHHSRQGSPPRQPRARR